MNLTIIAFVFNFIISCWPKTNVKILPRRACISCGFTKIMSSRYHRLLIYDVKRTTKIDGMGSFKVHVM